MILLDTNVLSALMRRKTDAAVIAWLDAQPPAAVWITAITIFEIRFGLEILAEGRKRKAFKDAFARAVEEDFDGRVLPFDRWRQTRPPELQHGSALPGVRSRSVTFRSPASHWRARPRLRPGTPVLSKERGSR